MMRVELSVNEPSLVMEERFSNRIDGISIPAHTSLRSVPVNVAPNIEYTI